MHLKVIACEVLAREIYHAAAQAKHTADISVFTQGLHNNPDTCRRELQQQIDAVAPDKFDALLLGYALCNNSIVGIRAGKVRMVVPRAHDCITFFLGDRRRYAEHFRDHPGTYYYTSGWLEYADRGGDRAEYTQKSGLVRQQAFEELAAKYGEENALYLIETMSAWTQHYTHGALIRFPFTDHLGLDAQVRKICAERGWDYAELQGDLGLIRDWLNGEWDEDRFLIVPPGKEIRATYGDDVVRCV